MNILYPSLIHIHEKYLALLLYISLIILDTGDKILNK